MILPQWLKMTISTAMHSLDWQGKDQSCHTGHWGIKEPKPEKAQTFRLGVSRRSLVLGCKAQESNNHP